LTGKYKTNPLHDNLHYSGLATDALARFGSLEIRTLRGVSDPQVIIEWVGMLRRLYDLSEQFTDPRRIPEMFSEMGPLGFFSEIMGPMEGVLRRDIHHSDQQIREAMMEGIRLAQDLCYCRNWSEYKEVNVKTDPFGRDTKKILASLMAATQALNVPPTSLNEGPFFVPPEPEPYYDDESGEEPHF
jgi:hypothetical protein